MHPTITFIFLLFNPASSLDEKAYRAASDGLDHGYKGIEEGTMIALDRVSC